MPSRSTPSPHGKLDFSLITDTIREKLPFTARLIDASPLAGDASNRRYFRLRLEGTVPSLILMQLADPDGFKASEEAVSGANSAIQELPFVNVLRHLEAVRIGVPTLHYYDEPAGLLYLQDFGDLTLLEACLKRNPSEWSELYGKAIDALVAIHLRATASRIDFCYAFDRAFDVPLLMWEFDHFLEYGVVARFGKSISGEDEQIIRDEFKKIAEWLAVQPQVFTHRDYHSRNLMVYDNTLGILDFQDALLGPVTYDLASLLRDSYVALDESLVETMIDRYVGSMSQELQPTTQERMLLHDEEAFQRLFDFTSIQRNLKAAGRFVYIDRIKHNSKFLEAIPRTLGYVRDNFHRYSELARLFDHLAPYVPEWQ